MKSLIASVLAVLLLASGSTAVAQDEDRTPEPAQVSALEDVSGEVSVEWVCGRTGGSRVIVRSNDRALTSVVAVVDGEPINKYEARGELQEVRFNATSYEGQLDGVIVRIGALDEDAPWPQGTLFTPTQPNCNTEPTPTATPFPDISDEVSVEWICGRAGGSRVVVRSNDRALANVVAVIDGVAVNKYEARDELREVRFNATSYEGRLDGVIVRMDLLDEDTPWPQGTLFTPTQPNCGDEPAPDLMKVDPVIGLLEIDGGAPATTSSTVELDLRLFEKAASADVEMRISEGQEDDPGAPWQPFAQSVPWSFRETSGTASVSVVFRAGTGPESPVFFDSIEIIEDGPAITFTTGHERFSPTESKLIRVTAPSSDTVYLNLTTTEGSREQISLTPAVGDVFTWRIPSSYSSFSYNLEAVGPGGSFVAPDFGQYRVDRVADLSSEDSIVHIASPQVPDLESELTLSAEGLVVGVLDPSMRLQYVGTNVESYLYDSHEDVYVPFVLPETATTSVAQFVRQARPPVDGRIAYEVLAESPDGARSEGVYVTDEDQTVVEINVRLVNTDGAVEVATTLIRGAATPTLGLPNDQSTVITAAQYVEDRNLGDDEFAFAGGSPQLSIVMLQLSICAAAWGGLIAAGIKATALLAGTALALANPGALAGYALLAEALTLNRALGILGAPALGQQIGELIFEVQENCGDEEDGDDPGGDPGGGDPGGGDPGGGDPGGGDPGGDPGGGDPGGDPGGGDPGGDPGGGDPGGDPGGGDPGGGPGGGDPGGGPGGGDPGGGPGGGDPGGGPGGGGSSVLDPHLRTYDGVSYDFQAAGEFVLTQSDVLTIHVRQEPFGSAASVNTAAGVLFHGDLLQYQRDDRNQILLNGEVVRLGLPLVTANGVQITFGSRSVRATDAEGREVILSDRGVFIDVRVRLVAGDVSEGLLGNPDGDPSDDFRTRGLVELLSPPTFEDVHGTFGESWRISQEESLLPYADGETTETFTIRPFPVGPLGIEDLGEAASRARDACRSAGVTDRKVLLDCTIDTAVALNETGGDLGFPEAAFLGQDEDRRVVWQYSAGDLIFAPTGDAGRGSYLGVGTLSGNALEIVASLPAEIDQSEVACIFVPPLRAPMDAVDLKNLARYASTGGRVFVLATGEGGMGAANGILESFGVASRFQEVLVPFNRSTTIESSRFTTNVSVIAYAGNALSIEIGGDDEALVRSDDNDSPILASAAVGGGAVILAPHRMFSRFDGDGGTAFSSDNGMLLANACI